MQQRINTSTRNVKRTNHFNLFNILNIRVFINFLFLKYTIHILEKNPNEYKNRFS